MTVDRLREIIKEVSGDVHENKNAIQFKLKDVYLMCVYDEAHDRMRFISPIVKSDSLTNEQKDRILEANYHDALDARYCISDGVVYSAFIHPLSSLSETDVLSAMYQVLSLNKSFGSTYFSGLMKFDKEGNFSKI